MICKSEQIRTNKQKKCSIQFYFLFFSLSSSLATRFRRLGSIPQAIIINIIPCQVTSMSCLFSSIVDNCAPLFFDELSNRIDFSFLQLNSTQLILNYIFILISRKLPIINDKCRTRQRQTLWIIIRSYIVLID